MHVPCRCNDETACNYVPYEAYCIEIEAYAEHDGVVGTTDLAGYTIPVMPCAITRTIS